MPEPIPQLAAFPIASQADAERQLQLLIGQAQTVTLDLQAAARAELDNLIAICQGTSAQCHAWLATAIADQTSRVQAALEGATGAVADQLHKQLAFAMAIAQENAVPEPPILGLPSPSRAGPGTGATATGPCDDANPDPLTSPYPVTAYPGGGYGVDNEWTVGVPVQIFLRQNLGSCTPPTWTASGLPPGLTLNEQTGEISGVPTTPGEYQIRWAQFGSQGQTTDETIRVTVSTTAPAANLLPDVAASTLATGTPQAQPTSGGATQTQTAPARPSETSSTSSQQGFPPASCPPPIINVEPATCPAAGAATPIIQGNVVQVYGSEEAWLVGGSVDRLLQSIQQYYGDIPLILGADDDPQKTLAPYFAVINPVSESTSASYPG